MSESQPSITIYSCSYCGAVPRELAAMWHMPYPVNAHVVEFPCISRVQADLILSAFEAGADGVLLVACEEGNCHHQDGNMRTVKRLEAMRELMDAVGIGGQRLALWQGGLGQPRLFVERLQEFMGTISALGLSPLKLGGKPGD